MARSKSRHVKPSDAGGLLDQSGNVVASYVPDFEECVLPYCTWYQDDFLGAVRGMKAAEIGIYTMLLNEMYESGQPVDMPLDRLARRCGTTKKTLQTTLEYLIDEGKIMQLDAGLWNIRVQKIFVDRRKNSTNNSKAGKKSGEKRNEINEGDERPLNEGLTGAEPNPETQSKSNNNSEDKSSSLLFSPGDPGNDNGYSDFLKAHPRPRETGQGERAWCDLLAEGTDAKEIIAAAANYARISKTYDRDKIKFADNWLTSGAWRNHIPSKAEAPPDTATKLEFWAGRILEGGKVFGLSEAIAMECAAAGLITRKQADAALAAS